MWAIPRPISRASGLPEPYNQDQSLQDARASWSELRVTAYAPVHLAVALS